MRTPNPSNLYDYRLMLVGARLMAEFVLEDHKQNLKDWKHCRKVLECAIKDKDSLSTLLFVPEINYEWDSKSSGKGKYEPFVKKIKPYNTSRNEIVDLIPEWKWLTEGGEIVQSKS